MAPVSFDLPPRSPWSSTSHLPKCKALLIGINYTCPPEDLGDRGPLRPLKGPVNDVKAFKDTLIGKSTWASLAFLMKPVYP
jgi:hypothetical protein